MAIFFNNKMLAITDIFTGYEHSRSEIELEQPIIVFSNDGDSILARDYDVLYSEEKIRWEIYDLVLDSTEINIKYKLQKRKNKTAEDSYIEYKNVLFEFS